MAKIAGNRSKKRSIYRNGRKGRNGRERFPPQRAQRWERSRSGMITPIPKLLRASMPLSKMQPGATEHHPRPESSAGGAAWV